MDYDEHILNVLMDKYERSAAYRDLNKINRGIYLEYSRQNMPDYFKDTSSRFKESINGTSIALENKEFIKIHWLKHEKGNIIEKVALNADKAQEIYLYLDRQPKKLKEQNTIAIAQKYMPTAKGWAYEFFEYIIASLEKGEGAAFYIDINDLLEVEDVFKSVNAIAWLEDEIPSRVFSIKVLGKSKKFEKIKGRVSRIARDFMKLEDVPEEDSILALCGIANNPVHVLFGGNLKVILDSKLIDFSCFKPDVGISKGTIDNLEIDELNFSKVVTIENLTTYHEFVKKYGTDILTVYLGGYPGLSEIKFLKRIKQAIESKGLDIPIYHWGDIDYGGFSIFKYLHNSLECDVKPLMMNVETLKRYKDFTAPLEQRYSSRLEDLLSDPDYSGFQQVVTYMLANNVKLEQECIDIEDVFKSFINYAYERNNGTIY